MGYITRNFKSPIKSWIHVYGIEVKLPYIPYILLEIIISLSTGRSGNRLILFQLDERGE